MSALYQVKQEIVQAGWPTISADDVELVEAEDGTPSLAIPLGSADTLIVTPEPLHPQRYTVLLDFRGVLSKEATIDQTIAFILRQLPRRGTNANGL